MWKNVHSIYRSFIMHSTTIARKIKIYRRDHFRTNVQLRNCVKLCFGMNEVMLFRNKFFLEHWTKIRNRNCLIDRRLRPQAMSLLKGRNVFREINYIRSLLVKNHVKNQSQPYLNWIRIYPLLRQHIERWKV